MAAGLPPAVLRPLWSFGDASALEAVFAKSKRGERVVVAAIGGSMTAGVGCSNGSLLHQHCAWPGRVAQWLSGLHGGHGVAYRNLARGGVRTADFLSSAPFIAGQLLEEEQVPADALLLFIDFSINDAYSISGTGANIERVRWSASTASDVADAAVALEQLIRVLIGSSPAASTIGIAGVLHACPPCLWLRDSYRSVYAHYRIPLIDFTRYHDSRPDAPRPLWPRR